MRKCEATFATDGPMLRLLVIPFLLLAACEPERRPSADAPEPAADAGSDAGPGADGGEPADAGPPGDAGTCVPETDQALCARLGRTCGEYGGFDNCGASRVVPTCGTCDGGLTCRAGACVDTACAPESDAELCAAAGRLCGAFEATDRCGTKRSIVSCGACATGVCTGGQCQTCNEESDQTFCARLGKNCGAASGADNCGHARSAGCGTCGNGLSCGAQQANVCGTGACIPEDDKAFCARLGKNCGAVTEFDNCGNARTVSFCGRCEAPETCGEGGTANVCGCVGESDASFCARNSKNCGTYTGLDRCNRSRTVACGTCIDPNTCGAATPNVCGCVSETDAAFCTRLGATCGRKSGTNNCGQSRTVDNCGTCSGQLQCGVKAASQCGCPEADAQLCTRLNAACGALTNATDACGQARSIASCGSCQAPETCGSIAANACACAPESDAQLCQAASRTCGLAWATDRCGTRRAAECGICPAPAGSGLAASGQNAAWATDGFGPSRQRLSPHVGPGANVMAQWRYTPPAAIAGQPTSVAIAADGTIYMGIDGGPQQPRPFLALRPNGTEKWRSTTVNISSSPAIGPAGQVYFCTSNGTLDCLTPLGTPCTGFPLATAGGACTGAPLVDHLGWVYVTGSTWVEGYSTAPARLFHTDVGARVTGLAVIGPDELLYVGNAKAELRAIGSATGAVIRTVPFATATSIPDILGPALSSDGTLAYVALSDGSLKAVYTQQHPVAAERGLVRWTFTTPAAYRRGVWAAPAVGPDGTIYLAANDPGELYAIAPGGTGNVQAKWAYPFGTRRGESNNAPQAPVVGADGTVFVVDSRGNAYAVSPAGTELWWGVLGDAIAGSLAIGRDSRLIAPLYSLWGHPSTLVAYGSW